MLIDKNGDVRCRSSTQIDGGVLVEIRNEAQSEWFKLFKINMEDTLTSTALAFSQDGQYLFALDATGRDKSVLIKIPAKEGGYEEKEVLHSNEKADVKAVRFNPIIQEI